MTNDLEKTTREDKPNLIYHHSEVIQEKLDFFKGDRIIC